MPQPQAFRVASLAGIAAIAIAACTTTTVGVDGAAPTPTVTQTPPDPCSDPGAVCSPSLSGVGDGGPAIEATLNRPVALALSTAANVLYVAETQGNRIRKIDLTSGVITTFAGNGRSDYPNTEGFLATEGVVNHPDSVAICPDGWIVWGESQENLILGVDPQSGRVAVIAGNGSSNAPAANGIDAHLAGIGLEDGAHLTCDGRNLLYVPDQFNDVVRVINRSAVTQMVTGISVAPGTIQTLAGIFGTSSTGGDNVAATSVAFNNPTAIVVLDDGSILFSESGNLKVRRVSPTGIVTTLAGTGTCCFTDATFATLGRTDSVWGMAWDPHHGSLFLQDNNQRMRLVNLSGAPVSFGTLNVASSFILSIAGTGRSTPFQDGALATSQGFDFIRANPVTDAAGNVYVPDSDNGVIRKIDRVTGTMTVIAGFAGHSDNLDYLDEPMGMATAADGTSLLFTAKNGRLWKLDPRVAGSSGIVAVAGTGNPTASGDGSAAINAGFSGDGIAVGPDGSIFVADHRNFIVRQIDPTGDIHTVAGTLGVSVEGGSGEGGLATAYKFDSPTGIAVDSTGNLFIVDEQNVRVVNMTAAPITVTGVTIGAGDIGTIAGGLTVGLPTGDGGPALSAVFNFKNVTIEGIAIDGSLLYVADGVNHKIRTIDLASPGGTVATVVGQGTAGWRGDGGPGADCWAGNIADLRIANGWLYWSQEDGGTIRRMLLPAGNVETIAGNGQRGFDGDGKLATDAQLAPRGLVVTADGTVWFADESHRIRRIHP